MSTKRPICRDCRFAKAKLIDRLLSSWDYAKCMHDSAVKQKEVNLVTGKNDASATYYCRVMRESGADFFCGAEGRFYETRFAKAEGRTP